MRSPAPATRRYAERLLPGWGACIVIAALMAMISVAYGAAFGPVLGWALFTGLVILGSFAIYRTSPAIAVTDEGLRAQGATLPWTCIGHVQALDRAQMRAARGPAGDARTYLVLRPWAAAGGVLVQVDDPADPHPAWLISSRNPNALAGAICAGHPAG